jgi:hypothetical protein
MSLHLEGLQRSREILDSAKTSYRKILKDLKNTDMSMSKPSILNMTGQILATGSEAGSPFKDLRGSSVFSSEEGGGHRSVYSAVQDGMISILLFFVCLLIVFCFSL